jgi:DNA-binding transcriptional ArsR family regulator
MKENKYDINKIKKECLYIGNIAKAINNETRVAILCLIAQQELNVGDIARRLSITQSTASLSLEKLLKAGLISRRRQGKFVYYKVEKRQIKKFTNVISRYFLK